MSDQPITPHNVILLRGRPPIRTVADAAQSTRPWLRRIAHAAWHTAKAATVAFGEWWTRRRTSRALSELDDYILKDLGITRSSLDRWDTGHLRAWRKSNHWR